MLSINKNWQSLIKPTVVYNRDSLNRNLVHSVIEPLERGFGLTFGNALRRVLLSSLQGAAITAIRVPGVLHEFSTLPGVKEDIVDLILNLKSVVVKMHTSEPQILKLKVSGPGVITAGMIEENSNVVIVSKDAKICHLAENASLEMYLTCEVGKNYVLASSRAEETNTTLDTILIDALFSPVRRVTYKVENTRVKQITDYDKLIFTVETNGSIEPESAIGYAAKILQDQMQVFINFDEVEEKISVEEKSDINPLLLKRLSDVELSVRSQNCLQNDNIIYIGDLVTKTESEMLKAQNFGRKSLNEIKEVLLKYNLTLGMQLPGWPPENLEELVKKYEDIL
ncbi:DNA-directed RNA polymerase subunit alpha [Rickettsia endosymbiont of Cardiosporidium cionae]|uniref:DNA-directed RNA polymerase subunit alpha n=1 Tax=Rickettsia endosymbiont of Cardiosporidium cionae TaxID=2777155 RepID=UPI00189634B1|nr:DNA-directed RNA polymerase subunit alpha [Rickettsia endosymbiont of Cardiosporidium cionae]KAF8818179.1 DNA-directed RNA polymerase subunit alpha [Rickettsia endosymbiont of Cardiosporidium cionae]